MTEQTLLWMRDAARRAVQELFDDPAAHDDPVEEQRILQQVCKDVGLNYEQVVLNNSTQYERTRMQMLTT